ncbi:acyl-CoA thioesterase [Leeia aquatica]|uniref:Acyl-CoA thioesterase n=1 Tax=Leeia aquatica TaxID=2725557 RepID=A0A847SFS7_9NEIS|nr:thioesterase family protein [Leeia aquatica]NLR76099.1 acyl-CoA thioesterase [Leeia aquatica]
MTPLHETIWVDVPFHDIDTMDVVWHGHYIKYLEIARCALLRKLDYDYPQMKASGFAWPVVECNLKYVRPARYGQRLAVTATLLEYENRLKLSYEIHDEQGARLTKAVTTQVAVCLKTGEMQFVSPACLLERGKALCDS